MISLRRPFANAPRNDPYHQEMMYRPMGAMPPNQYPGTNNPMMGGMKAFDETSAVHHLRKNQLTNEENFMEKIKDWETSTQQK